MTEAQFLALPPQERDAMVATEVMGHEQGQYAVFGKHEWVTRPDGEIEMLAWDADHHNGPVCDRCGDSFCEHCEADNLEERLAGPCQKNPIRYTENISAAWQVVEKMREEGWWLRLNTHTKGCTEATFGAFGLERHDSGWLEKPALAICLAALKTRNVLQEANPPEDT